MVGPEVVQAGQPEAGKPNSNKKKWIIGCSGCLVVVVILVVAVAILGGVAFNKLVQTSNTTVQEILGDSYKAPQGTTAIGIPVGQGEIRKMVILLDLDHGHAVFALQANIAESDMAQIKSGDKAKIEEYIKRFGQYMQTNASSSKLDLANAKFDSTALAELPNGKAFPLSLAVVKTTNRKGESYTPVAIGIIPEGPTTLVAVLLMDGQNASTSPDTDFSSAEKILSADMMTFIISTELDDRLK